MMKTYVGAFYYLNSVYYPYVLDFDYYIYSSMPKVVDKDRNQTIHPLMGSKLKENFTEETLPHQSDNYIDQTRGLVDYYPDNDIQFVIFIGAYPEDDLNKLINNTLEAFQLESVDKISIVYYNLSKMTKENDHISGETTTYFIDGKGNKLDGYN